MSLPDFVKQGSVLSAPTWLTSTSNTLTFPRLFDNDAYRSTLTGLSGDEDLEFIGLAFKSTAPGVEFGGAWRVTK